MIKLENVSKTYRSKVRSVPVLSGVNLDVARGTLLLLEGPSGVGKTTLLNIMGCLVRPSAGHLLIDGRSMLLPEYLLCQVRRRYIGFVFQQFNLINGHTLLENVAMPLLPIGVSPKKRKKLAIEKLSMLSLTDKQDFDVKDLSGGEQQRASIARALINEPDIILADEPTSNIDSDNAGFVIDILAELKNSGKTVVVSSHDERLTKAGIADDVLFI